MSRRQPTLAEAIEQAARVERTLAAAIENTPIEGGFWVRLKRHRWGWEVLWPVCDITARCDDCGCVLRDARDAGSGFYYDRRWLRGDPSTRDPRLSEGYEPHFVCLRCFNRARPLIRKAEAINETRLAINRIRKELRHAA